MIIPWLAAVLRGDCPDWPFSANVDIEQILETANHEGVLALLHEGVFDPNMAEKVPASLSKRLTKLAQIKAMQSLAREHHCRLILKRLEQAEIPTLLLKGSALAYWAYRSPHLRECSDIDLLFRSREDVDRTTEILEELSFASRDPVLPGDLVCFEITTVGFGANNGGLEIDLHWRLSGSPMFAFRFDWNELHAGSIELRSLAPSARGIAAAHAFLHACMHRAQNMAIGLADILKWLYDLVILGKGFDPKEWDDLVDLAIDRGLAGVCVDGIRAASIHFGKFAPEAKIATLVAAATQEPMDVNQLHRWRYIQRMNLMAFQTTRERLRWLRQRLIPDPAYLRYRYGEAAVFNLLAARLRAGVNRLLR